MAQLRPVVTTMTSPALEKMQRQRLQVAPSSGFNISEETLGGFSGEKAANVRGCDKDWVPLDFLSFIR